jgi:hypothetical protein
MKKILFLLFLPMLAQAQMSKKTLIRKYQISFSITQTSDWCGGMRPTDDMLKEFSSPKPFPNKWIYIKKNRKGKSQIDIPILDSFESNEQGEIACKLPEGNYQIVESWNKDSAVYLATLERYKIATEFNDTIDKACFDKVFNQPYFLFQVSKSFKIKRKHVLNFHKTCNYSGSKCVRYKGPYPN